MELAIILLVVVLLDIVALRWGVDSREKIDSFEWERRKHFLSGNKNREENSSENFGITYRQQIELLPDCQNCH
jgi:hypothetical protein